jgi:hypothetical protein
MDMVWSVSSTRRITSSLLHCNCKRTVCDFVEYRGIEELDIRILKDERYASPEIQKEFFLLKELFGERVAFEFDRTGRGKIERIQNSQERGLAGAVGAEQRNPIPCFDVERESADRRDRFVGEADVLQFENCRQFPYLPIHTTTQAVRKKAVRPT